MRHDAGISPIAAAWRFRRAWCHAIPSGALAIAHSAFFATFTEGIGMGMKTESVWLAAASTGRGCISVPRPIRTNWEYSTILDA